MRALSTALTVLALAAAVGGCGDDDEPGAGGTGATPEAAAPDGEAGGAVAIGMRGLKFDPDQATVKVGQAVTWTNNEDIPHNVVAQEGADFESDTFAKDGTFSHTPAEAGTITYVCTLHPGMDGTLTVEE
jgi:plastocyanin